MAKAKASQKSGRVLRPLFKDRYYKEGETITADAAWMDDAAKGKPGLPPKVKIIPKTAQSVEPETQAPEE